MSDFYNKIRNAYENEYTNAYAMKNRGLYSIPKIYDANGDLSKRWYVYFSFRNPKTGKMERQTPVYLGVNKLKKLSDRREAIKVLRDALEKALANGTINPYENTYSEIKIINIAQAVELALKNAQATMRESSFKDYKSRINKFEKWLNNNGFSGRSVQAITKKTVLNFLNDVLEKTSAKNRNNTRSNLSIFFKYLEDNEYIAENFVSKIPVLNAKPERNKTYTQTQESQIFNYLEKNDKLLLLMIKFVSYNFLRPIEVCRLQIKNIDFEGKKLVVDAKNKLQKTKIIPEILFQEIQYLKGSNSEFYLFAPEGVNHWNTTETNKRDYWSKRFKKVKDVFGLGKDYGLYSFRHTFITKLYRELRKELTPFEVKSRLMLITGHTTITALEKYLRDIDAELPEDYSDLIH
ncbi:integrase [Capnocytophaga canimorsus]|uniref:Integrase n=1 Tax=Capnocytophaga canimorsus TaxID=28188 RepID=A0AAD0E9H0_9FLAO|nr:site-specific integrase [Capnocytophaga canimorsus]ATA93039.1 integrase [Capnocytophaga canimorsus]